MIFTKDSRDVERSKVFAPRTEESAEWILERLENVQEIGEARMSIQALLSGRRQMNAARCDLSLSTCYVSFHVRLAERFAASFTRSRDYGFEERAARSFLSSFRTQFAYLTIGSFSSRDHRLARCIRMRMSQSSLRK